MASHTSSELTAAAASLREAAEEAGVRIAAAAAGAVVPQPVARAA